MVVCKTCKKEMSCETNGVQVRFGTGEHCYAGDTFKCPTCDYEVVVTNGTPWQDTNIFNNIHIDGYHRSLTDNKYNIWMDK